VFGKNLSKFISMEKLEEFIEINPKIMMGKPIIKGTRIPIEQIIEELASGYTRQEILNAHPRLNDEHITAALQYASAILKNEKIYVAAS
jgi:uncharacterized protein (DUF433 family)